MSKDRKTLAGEVTDLIRKTAKPRRDGKLIFKFDNFLKEWQNHSPDTAFSSFGFGKLKKFLQTDCFCQEHNPANGEFCFKEPGKSGKKEKKKKKGHAQQQASEEGTVMAVDETAREETSDQNACTDENDTFQAQKTEISLKNAKSEVKGQKSDTSVMEEEKETATGGENQVPPYPDRNELESFESFEVPEHSKSRFGKMVIALYDCGLIALRYLFLKFHKGWKNCPNDIVKFNYGNFRCDFKDQKQAFCTGNIYSWDITLICKVLLFRQLSGDKKLESAVNSIRQIKNKLVSHKTNPHLTKDEYTNVINDMEAALTDIGFSKTDFRSALKEDDLAKSDTFHKLYMEEAERCIINRVDEAETRILSGIDLAESHISSEVKAISSKVEEVSNKMDDLVEEVKRGKIQQSKIPSYAVRQDPASWDEWLRIAKEAKKFDADHNQYILIIDRDESSSSAYPANLGRIPWKLVLDLDPNSDIDGLFKNIFSSHENSAVFVSHTPSQLEKPDPEIDFNKRVQWVFANGRNEDTDEDKPKENFKDWRLHFKAPISKLLHNCSSDLERMKPVFCIVLSSQSSTCEIAKALVKEVEEIFFKFSPKFISISPNFSSSDMPENSIFSTLSPKFLYLGIYSLFGATDDTYRLPSPQENIMVPLESEKYNYLSEYLEILYKDCEKIPEELQELDAEEFENDHLLSFLKGNLISFESLYFDHDARRKLTTDIINQIHKLCYRGATAQIVEISHSPGTGGSTIARRVIWDLRKEFPCLIAKLPPSIYNYVSDPDGNQLVANLSQRIGVVEKLCELMPIVLIDGNSRQVRSTSDCLVRKLNADGIKAVVLRVVRPQRREVEEDNFYKKQSSFHVKAVLGDDKSDLDNFRMVYENYLRRFEKSKQRRNEVRESTRVFHFPMIAMMAMMGDLTHLKDIVRNCLDILRDHSSEEYEIAVLVAFLQIYSGWETPASLIAKYFANESSTIVEAKQNFSDDFLSLLVSKKASSKNKWIGSKNYRRNWNGMDVQENDILSSEGLEWYTFQHLIVAELVIKHSELPLDEIATKFVSSVIEEYTPYNRFKDLINDLFLFNKEKADDHFSVLIMKVHNGGKIFEEAAKRTMDAPFYSHVARYFSIQEVPPDFEKARRLIQEGLKDDKHSSKDKRRQVRYAEGHILLKEMWAKRKAGTVKTVEDLKHYAGQALKCFANARDNPPMTYPNPLIGEIYVWQFCLDWIIKWKENNVKSAVLYMSEDDFFKNAISQCYELLDEIDHMVESVPWLSDPTHTRKLANDNRVSLTETFGRSTKRGKKGTRLCEEICLKQSFKTGKEKDKEVIRLQCALMLNRYRHEMHLMNDADRQELFRLLEKFVRDYKGYKYAKDLITVSTMQKDKAYTLEDALQIVKEWKNRSPHDAFVTFFEYVICFLGVINGGVFRYLSQCKTAIEECKKMNQENSRKYWNRFYIEKKRDIGKMSCLISPTGLGKYTQGWNLDHEGEDVWRTEARKYLHECSGRIRLERYNNKEFPQIALEPGDLRISVENNSIGKAYQDYQPDSRIKFMVYFTLDGPKAKGIRFVDE